MPSHRSIHDNIFIPTCSTYRTQKKYTICLKLYSYTHTLLGLFLSLASADSLTPTRMQKSTALLTDCSRNFILLSNLVWASLTTASILTVVDRLLGISERDTIDSAVSMAMLSAKC